MNLKLGQIPLVCGIKILKAKTICYFCLGKWAVDIALAQQYDPHLWLCEKHLKELDVYIKMHNEFFPYWKEQIQELKDFKDEIINSVKPFKEFTNPYLTLPRNAKILKINLDWPGETTCDKPIKLNKNILGQWMLGSSSNTPTDGITFAMVQRAVNEFHRSELK